MEAACTYYSQHQRKLISYSFLPLVEIPKGRYKGQKLIILVPTNITATTIDTIAQIPVMVWVK